MADRVGTEDMFVSGTEANGGSKPELENKFPKPIQAIIDRHPPPVEVQRRIVSPLMLPESY